MKIINKKHLVNQDLLKDEVEILKRVGNHRNILHLIKTYDSIEEFYIVTELCKGGDLFGRIVQEGSLSEKDTVGYMKQLVCAIEHIHSCGVTHRDLKPENILLSNTSKSAVLKVADFGLSKIRQDGDIVMKTVCGTWAYCAPEVIRREKYTNAVDNWTIGILMFVILAGYHPFDIYGDATEAELLKRIEEVQYDFDDEVWDEVSQEAQNIITGCLQTDPEKRMKASEFLAHPWTNGKVYVNKKNNAKAVANLTKIVDLRKKMKVTFLTTKMVGKFKSKLKVRQSMAQGKGPHAPPAKQAWANVLTVPEEDCA